ALGVGFLVGGPLIRVLRDRVPPRRLLAGALLGVAASFWALFSSTTLGAALPAAVAIGVFGSMALVVPQTALQRALPNEVLGRVSAVFFTAEALATLVGAVAGPTLAEAAHIDAVKWMACGVTVLAAALCAMLPAAGVATAPEPDSVAEPDSALAAEDPDDGGVST